MSKDMVKLCPHCNKMFFSDADIAPTGLGFGFDIDIDAHAIVETPDGRPFSLLSVGMGALFIGGPTVVSGIILGDFFNIAPQAVVLAGCVGALAGALLTFAVALHAPVTRLHEPDIVEVDDLVRTGKNTMKLRRREIELPLDGKGKPLFKAKQLVSFANMAVDPDGTISEGSAKGFGLSRRPYTTIREWCIEQAYLRYNNPDVPQQGVYVTGSGRRFFESAAALPSED